MFIFHRVLHSTHASWRLHISRVYAKYYGKVLIGLNGLSSPIHIMFTDSILCLMPRS